MAQGQPQGRRAPPQGAALARQQADEQKKKSNIQTLAQIIQSKAGSFAAVAGRHLSAERLMKLAQTALGRTPKLAECTPMSIIASLIRCAELGLEPGSLVGGVHLVPFKNENKIECQPIIDYRGVIALVRRSGELKELNAYVVHKKDSFLYELGDDPKIHHRPYTPPDLSDEEIAKLKDEEYAALMDPGPLKAVYMVARLKDGGVQREVMTRLEIERIRRRSKASTNGPWVTDYDEMAKKTVVKRGSKYLPMATEAQISLEQDRQIEEGEVSAIDLTGLEPEALPAATPTDTSSKVEAKLTGEKTTAPPTTDIPADKAQPKNEPKPAATQAKAQDTASDNEPPEPGSEG